MSRGRGGYIGFNRVPAASAVNSAASGIWTLREAEALKRAGTWPRAGEVPEQITGLQLWLDASDAPTLYDATTGGSLVAADGGVARWEDKSGNGRHATQGTSGSRPLRKAAVQGGRDVLRFDGSNDSLSIPGSTATFKFLHSQDATVFLVAKPGTVADPNSIYALFSTNSNGSTGTVGYILWYEDRVVPDDNFFANDNLRHVIGPDVVANLNQGVAGFTANTFSVASAITRPSQAVAADRVAGRINGGAAVSGNALTGTLSTENASANLTIGQLPNGDMTLAGDIAEIIIYNSALSDANRSLVESYLMSKWGIS